MFDLENVGQGHRENLSQGHLVHQCKEFYVGWCIQIKTKNIPIWILIYLVTSCDLLYIKAPLLSVPAVFTALYK